MTLSLRKVSMLVIASAFAMFMVLATTTSASAVYNNKKESICRWTDHGGGNWYWRYDVLKDGDFKFEGERKEIKTWCNEQRTVDTEPVVFVDPTCEEAGSYTVPEVMGVVYSEDAGTYEAEDGDDVEVTAEAAEMYFLVDGADTEWSHEFAIDEECEEEEEPEVLAAVTQVEVTPTGPVNAGGAGTLALTSLVASAAALSFGVLARKASQK